jgi:mRNA interferase RelE/StbE
MYKVEVAVEAAKFIRQQDTAIRRQIINKLRALAKNPRPQTSKKLHGYHELYRIPSGNYRIVYTIREKMLMVLIVRIAHRKEVYRHLGR